MMLKFDVGETVLLKATVTSVDVDKYGATYSLIVENKKSPIRVHESEIIKYEVIEDGKQA